MGDREGRPQLRVPRLSKPGPADGTRENAAVDGPSLALARELWESGRTSEATECLKAVIRGADSRQAAEAHYALAGIAREADDPDRAEGHLRRCLELAEEHLPARLLLARVQAARGATEQARTNYQRVLTIDPDARAAREGLQALSRTPTRPREDVEGKRGDTDRARGVHQLLAADGSPRSRETLRLLELVHVHRRSPRLAAYAGAMALHVALVAALLAAADRAGDEIILALPGGWQVRLLTTGLQWAAVAFGTLLLYRWLVYATTRLSIEEGRVKVERGILQRRLNSLELWRVHDIELQRSLANRLTGDGSLHFFPSAMERGRPVCVVGVARGQRLDELYGQLLDLVALLRSNPALKGIIT